MATIDNLDIQIKADASRATTAIDSLVNSLSKLNNALSSNYGANLSRLANGVSSLGLAMGTFKQNANASTFNSLAKSLNSVNSIDTSNFATLANTLQQFNSAVASIANVNSNATNITQLANSLGKLGSGNVVNAVAVIPQLQNALVNLITALSQAPAVSTEITQLVNSITSLVRASNTTRTINKSITQSFNNMSNSAHRARNSFNGLASAIGKFYATYFLAIRGIKSLGSAIEKSMDYVETYNYFSVTMDKIGKEYNKMYERFGYESAEEYAQSFTNRMNTLTKKMTGYNMGNKGELNLTDSIGLGLDPETLVNYEAKIGAITNSIGLIGETSINTSKALSMLSADLSSLTNTDISTVMGNLQSGLVGQSRALYKYGVDITNANLSQLAFTLGIEKSVSEMSQQEKMQLRILSILQQTKVAWGDQANTLDSVANQYRVLKQQMSNFSRTLGNLFLPIIQRVLPAINGLVVALNDMFTALGFKLYGDSWLTDLQDGISTGAPEIVDDVEEIGETAEETAEKVKKLSDNLQGFDEINKLNDNDVGTTGVTGLDNTLDLSKEIADALAEYESVWDKALATSSQKIQQYREKFNKFLEPIKETFRNLYEGKFFDAGQNTGNIIMSIYNYFSNAIASVDWAQLGTNIADYYNGVLSQISGKDIAHGINNLVNATWDLFTSFFKEFDWKQLFRIVGDIFKNLDWVTIAKLGFSVGMLKLAKNMLTVLGSGISSGFKGVFSRISGNVGTLASNFGTGIGNYLVQGLKSPFMVLPSVVSAVLVSISDSYAKTADAFAKSKGEIDEDTKGLVDSADEVIEKSKKMREELDDALSVDTTQADSLQIIADKYFNLAGQIGLTEEQLATLEGYKQTLSQNEEFKKILDDENTSLIAQRDAINEVISKLKEKAIAESASSSVTKIAEQILPVQSTIDELTDKEQEAKDKMNGLYGDLEKGQKRMLELAKYYNNKTGSWSAGLGMSSVEIAEEFKKLSKLYNTTTFNESLPSNLRASDIELAKIVSDTENVGKKARDAEANWSEVNQRLRDSKDELKQLNTEMDYYAGIASGSISTTTSLYQYQKDIADQTKETQNNLVDAIENTSKTTNDIFGENGTATNIISDFVKGAELQFSDLQKNFSNMSFNIEPTLKQPKGNLIDLIMSGIDGNDTTNGSAILGSINVIGQVASAGAQAVNVNVTLEGDTKNLFNAIVKENNNYVKTNGWSPFN